MPKRTNDAELTLLGRIGAHAMHAKYDSRETTRAARAAFSARFEHAVDPDRVLGPGRPGQQ